MICSFWKFAIRRCYNIDKRCLVCFLRNVLKSCCTFCAGPSAGCQKQPGAFHLQFYDSASVTWPTSYPCRYIQRLSSVHIAMKCTASKLRGKQQKVAKGLLVVHSCCIFQCAALPCHTASPKRWVHSAMFKLRLQQLLKQQSLAASINRGSRCDALTA